MIAYVRSFSRFIAYFLSPPRCSFCKQSLSERVVFCKTCQDFIRPIVSCSLAISPHTTMNVLSVSEYHDPLKTLIMAKRWSDRIASRQLGQIIWEQTGIRHMQFDYIIPIPLHWSRYTSRGFNQAWEIAEVIASRSGKPLADILYRTRRTVFQSYMSRAQRADNVKSVFQCKVSNTQHLYHHKKLLLVDDVMTTGSTLRAAAKTLMMLRPTRLTAAVGCRVLAK